MQKVIHLFLKYTWMIRFNKDAASENEWDFNFYNPFGWCMLAIVSVIIGIVEGALTTYQVIRDTIKDSKKP